MMRTTRVLTGLSAVAAAPKRAVVTVGVFDGVHLAHQRLIRTVVDAARRLRGTAVGITFDPDPQAVLDPACAPAALMPLDARVERLQVLGLDWVWIIPFTRRFASMSAERFVRRILIERLRAAMLVVGESFFCGRDRGGDLKTLRAIGAMHGMQVVAVRQMRRGGRPISSSRIRRLIQRGRLAEARQLLGRPPALHGVVVSGAGRGRALGFPTANLRLAPQILPPTGVYAVAVERLDSHRRWPGVMNFGVRPTFGPGPLVCEVHVLGFAGALRGRPLAVSLVARLRGERRFPHPDALRRQVRRDLSRTRRLLRKLSGRMF